MVWRNDWENRTKSGNSWDIVKKGGCSAIGGGGSGRVVGNVLPPQDEPPLQKHAQEDDTAPTPVGRDDTGQGIDFSSLFSPDKADTPGMPPQVDPLLKLQKAQLLLGQQLQRVVPQLQQMGEGMTQLQQVVQQLAQGQQQLQQMLSQPPPGMSSQGPAPQGPEGAPPQGPSSEMPPQGPPPETPPQGMMGQVPPEIQQLIAQGAPPEVIQQAMGELQGQGSNPQPSPEEVAYMLLEQGVPPEIAPQLLAEQGLPMELGQTVAQAMQQIIQGQQQLPQGMPQPPQGMPPSAGSMPPEGAPPEGAPPEGPSPEGPPPGSGGEGELPPPEVIAQDLLQQHMTPGQAMDMLMGQGLPPDVVQAVTQMMVRMNPQELPEVGPDGLVVEPAPPMPPPASHMTGPPNPPNPPSPPIPPGLEFDEGVEEEAYMQAPKRELPSQLGPFNPPGAELAAGLPPTLRLETNIKHSEQLIKPQELADELASSFGPQWVQWEPETLFQTWTQTHGSPPDDELMNKILGLQALLGNPDAFWSDPMIFRDVLLALNGVPPIMDDPAGEDEDSLSPGQIVYGVFVASQLAPLEQLGVQEPSEEVKQYVAVQFAVGGLVSTIIPVRWAQPYLDQIVAQNSKITAGLDSGMVNQRLLSVLNNPEEIEALNENSPLDLQVLGLLNIKQYVEDMEAGI